MIISIDDTDYKGARDCSPLDASDCLGAAIGCGFFRDSRKERKLEKLPRDRVVRALS